MTLSVVCYDYQRTRDGDHAKQFLTGFSGYLHPDGYAGYNDLPGVTLVGCWAHARRKFTDAAKVLPKSALGEAVGYCRKQWSKLVVFLEDGRLEISNNRAERSTKPFVIGRKNWLFANRPRGARISALIYSLVEAAKENGLKPLEYLTYVFERLPDTDPNDTALIDSLLPWSDLDKSALQGRPPPPLDHSNPS